MNIILSDREAELMNILWEHGPSTVNEVQARIADELAYTTVLTMLRNLEAKGYVTHEANGKAHRYLPAIKRETAQRSALRHLTSKLFGGSAPLLLTQLVSDRKLSDDELRTMRKLLAEQGKKGTK